MPLSQIIKTWIFDLDNTLYPAHCRLFEQVDHNMGVFIADFLKISTLEAKIMQKDFFVRYGTTLAGLIAEHGVTPDDFLNAVHQIDYTAISANDRLRKALLPLSGRKFIFTNGTRQHAQDVLEKIGIIDLFDDIFDIYAANFIPKPQRKAYELFLTKHKIAPETACMFEDIIRNLQTPKELSMTTVLVTSKENNDAAYLNEQDPHPTEHIDFFTENVENFLETVRDLTF